MDGHHLGHRKETEAQNPAYDRLTVTHPADQAFVIAPADRPIKRRGGARRAGGRPP